MPPLSPPEAHVHAPHRRLRRPRAPAELRGSRDAHRGALRVLGAEALQRRAARRHPPRDAGRRAPPRPAARRVPRPPHVPRVQRRLRARGRRGGRGGGARRALRRRPRARRRGPPLLRHGHRDLDAVARREAREPARAAGAREAHAHLRPRVHGRRGRARPRVGRPARLPRRGGGARLGGALLAHAPARGRLGDERDRERALRRRRRGGGARGRRARAPSRARAGRGSRRPARSSTRRRSG